MSYSPKLSTVFNRTNLRTENSFNSQSGMCSMCTADCTGTCEIGLSAVLGKDTVYPTTTGDNQVASEKVYPLDFSHFNINGRVFGAMGIEPDSDKAILTDINLETTIGKRNPIKMKMPVVLPALIKLNWKDYFSGAAMAGVICTIGEGSFRKDPNAVVENGKIKAFPKLNEMLDAFRDYYHGYGQIFLQCNVDDDGLGIAEYALKHCGAEAIEFKFGQSAKGVQPVSRIKSLEEALYEKSLGAVVRPDPEDPEVVKKYNKGKGTEFRLYYKLPMWDENYLVPHIEELRKLGMKNVSLKMAGYDKRDLEHVLRIAALADVDMVTFDGAGGGTGNSPCKMMNEWGLPPIVLESYLVDIIKKLEGEGLSLPSVIITGGFSMEDSVFKALAFGDHRISAVGLCRASMAAAMSGKKIGELLKKGIVPKELQRFGSTKEELFVELRNLREIYGDKANDFETGAIGVYSYLQRVAYGLQHFLALNRKFDVKYIDREDIFPLTRDAKDLFDGNWF